METSFYLLLLFQFFFFRFSNYRNFSWNVLFKILFRYGEILFMSIVTVFYQSLVVCFMFHIEFLLDKNGNNFILSCFVFCCNIVIQKSFFSYFMYEKNEKAVIKQGKFNGFRCYLHVSFTELPSGTITSDDVSSDIKSGGMTTSKYPI